MQGSLGLQPAGLGEQSDEASEGERAEDAAPASGLAGRWTVVPAARQEVCTWV